MRTDVAVCEVGIELEVEGDEGRKDVGEEQGREGEEFEGVVLGLNDGEVGEGWELQISKLEETVRRVAADGDAVQNEMLETCSAKGSARRLKKSGKGTHF